MPAVYIVSMHHEEKLNSQKDLDSGHRFNIFIFYMYIIQIFVFFIYLNLNAFDVLSTLVENYTKLKIRQF